MGSVTATTLHKQKCSGQSRGTPWGSTQCINTVVPEKMKATLFPPPPNRMHRERVKAEPNITQCSGT
eukprot:10248147-Alexandrium_andersonii.AAC.1